MIRLVGKSSRKAQREIIVWSLEGKWGGIQLFTIDCDWNDKIYGGNHSSIDNLCQLFNWDSRFQGEFLSSGVLWVFV